MPRYLAVEWDQQHVRFAVVTSGRAQVKVAHAVTVPLPPTGDDREARSSEAIGKKLGAALAAHGVSIKRAIVCVGRATVEIQRLTLPPCPDEDLPDLVRNQAMRELSSAGDSSIIDYVPLGHDPSQPRRVIAAAMTASEHRFVQEVCEHAGLTPRQLVLRPYATASRFLAAEVTEPGACMLVDVSGHEAELVVLDGPHAVFTRAILLPADSVRDALLDPLLPEISRTIMAVQNQADIESVERVFVSGETEHHKSLLDQIRAELEIPAEVFDPFADLSVAPSTEVERAGQPGRFTALLGALYDEARGTAPSIDFANPRRRPAAPNRRRQVLTSLAVAAAAVAAFFYYAYQHDAKLEKQYLRLKDEATVRAKAAETADQMVESVAEIEAWTDGDVNWLDEFRELSDRFPNRRDAVLSRLTMQRAAGGGVMVLEGLVRAPAIVGRMEESLRDDYHKVNSDNLQEKAVNGSYAWQFDTEVSVAKRDKTEYASVTPPATTDDTIRPSIPATTAPASPTSNVAAAASGSSTTADGTQRGVEVPTNTVRE
ncbi:MAG: hypothetical protein KDA63_21540 [Planctomycetales bacterium]|nr:hypothetical protein [Planctomycetales bacterium]